uniref:MHD domain-containing protein n=1 Tax=Corethron hystrix TaxID=216773 RepID=A0A7S1FZ06_9STRA|mmetsp:Transcript_4019/g.7701  ORF Transcript_4019/g.7701 Transcript_4019/m.7701 type:complete len:580 (+) Transcript_4019:214-1953(+)
MISTLFILSPRGDTILNRTYRSGCGKGSGSNVNDGADGGPSSDLVVLAAHERSYAEEFFRRVKFWGQMTTGSDPSNGSGGMGGSDGDAEEKKDEGPSGQHRHDVADDDPPTDAQIVGDPRFGSSDPYNNASIDACRIQAVATDGEDMAARIETGEDAEEDSSGAASGSRTDAPPVFRLPDGLSYLHVKRNGLYFVASTPMNVSPTATIELLSKVARVAKDYCGTLSEESIRRNFVLLYELIDEMVDYGYPQITRTEDLKTFIYNEPIMVAPAPGSGIGGLGGLAGGSGSSIVNPKTASASAVNKPVISGITVDGKKQSSSSQKNEIFVDILERLNVLFTANGYVLNSSIDGCIQMKSYLAGKPELRLALNEDLVIGKGTGSYGAVVLDDCNFNDCCNLTDFDSQRTLSFYPPDGEFSLVNYRMTSEFRPPFRIFPSVEETAVDKLEVSVMVRAEMPDTNYGANVVIEVPLPRCTSTASCSVSGNGQAEYIATERKVLWNVKKFLGGSESSLRISVTIGGKMNSQIRKEVGPVSMNFEVPMFNVSNLQVRYLRLANQIPGYSPYRWVRYVTQSSSYVCRV